MTASTLILTRLSANPFNNDATVCGFVLQPSAVLSQMLDFMAQAIDSGLRNVVAIVHEANASLMLSEELPQLDNVALLCADTDDLTAVDWLTIVFAQESNFAELFRFNASVIKIGLPHGTDIAVKTTLLKYGGCLEFDYILCHSHYAPMFDNAFAGRFPKFLRTHNRNYCCAIPFGMPKFDKFLQICQQQPRPEAIIYHLSNLKIEPVDVVEKIPVVLQVLLEEFPSRPIIFRPFPKDLKHPLINRVIEQYKNKPNFQLSASASYIEDYARGALMVCHRNYTNHLFVQASGRPVVLIKNNLEELIKEIQLKLLVEAADYAGTLVHNPGNSVAYLLDNFSYITEDRVHPDWQYFALDNDDITSSVDKVLAEHIESGLPFHKVALAAHRLERTVKTLAACIISFSRSPLLQNHELAKQSWDYAFKLYTDWVRMHRITTDEWQQIVSALQVSKEPFREYFITQLLHIKEIEIPLFVKEWLRVLQVSNLPSRGRVGREYRLVSDKQPHSLKAGPVQLYGAGQLAEEIMGSEAFSKRFTVVNVVDKAEDLHGQIFFGHAIAAPDSLNDFDAPVVICSQAFFEEIYWSLLNVYDVKNNLYRLV